MKLKKLLVLVLVFLVCFSYRNVSAKEKTTGKEQKIRIESSSNLSKEDIERMKREAEENAENDRKEREMADKLNEVDNIIFQTEKQLKEYGDKIPGDIKGKIEGDLAELRKAKEDKNLETMNTAKDKLTADVQAIYQAMQNAQNANAGANNTDNSNSSNSENTQDANYEEV